MIRFMEGESTRSGADISAYLRADLPACGWREMATRCRSASSPGTRRRVTSARQPRGNARNSSSGARPFMASTRPFAASRCHGAQHHGVEIFLARVALGARRHRRGVADIQRRDAFGHETDLLLRTVDEHEAALRAGDSERNPGKSSAGSNVDDPARGAQVRCHRQAVEHVQRQDAIGRIDGRQVHLRVAFAQQQRVAPENVHLRLIENDTELPAAGIEPRFPGRLVDFSLQRAPP
jgi:hypothetical protein